MASKMELPPRRSRKLQEITIRRNRTNLDVLMQMGFPQHRAEKSLAATGDKGVQLASDWLLSHVNDTTLDETTPRDYILYLCPVGKVQQELLEFWQKSYQLCGWNRAHNYFPHVTLCSFFKSEDAQISKLAHSLKTVCERIKDIPNKLPLEYFSSANFIGLFVSDSMAAILKQITSDFAEEVRKFGVNVDPHRKQLHISLLYQFPTEHKERVENLAKSINLGAMVRWDLRLYSRDSRYAKHQVRKVRFPHTPQDVDELELTLGDFIYVEESEIEASPDGWYPGTSWLTGTSGLFPGNYTERAAETETWTMHRSIPIIGTDGPETISAETHNEHPLYDEPFVAGQQTLPTRSLLRNQGAIPKRPKSAIQTSTPPLTSPKLEKKALPGSLDSKTTNSKPQAQLQRQPSDPKVKLKPTKTSPASASASAITSNSSSKAAYSGTKQSPGHSNSTSSSPNHTKRGHNLSSPIGDERNGGAKVNSGGTVRTGATKATEAKTASSNKGPRQLYVIRHGERIDFTFGKDWIQNSFDSAGHYIRYDLNMPKALPKRKGGPSDFHKDSPLTVQGHFQAKLVGEALHEKNIPFTHIYASPSLRCVETATDILAGMGLNLPIYLEPGLFEWLGWYRSGLPRFLTPQEYRECGFNVAQGAPIVWPESRYNLDETTEQYYDRCHFVTKEILSRHEETGSGGSVVLLFVAHKASIDVCTRQLRGKRPRTRAQFRTLVENVPFCAIGGVREAGVGVERKSMKSAERNRKRTWEMVEPPIRPFTHKSNAKYSWKIWLD